MISDIKECKSDFEMLTFLNNCVEETLTSLSHQSWNYFLDAASRNYLESLKFLAPYYGQRAKLLFDRKTALSLASESPQSNYKEVYAFLMTLDLNPDAGEYLPTVSLAQIDRFDLIQYLIDTYKIDIKPGHLTLDYCSSFNCFVNVARNYSLSELIEIYNKDWQYRQKQLPQMLFLEECIKRRQLVSLL